MGFFDSSSSSKKYTTTTYETNTSSTVRDLGLTGAAAVDMASVLSYNQMQQSLGFMQQAGGSYQQLIGGANNLIFTGQEQSDKMLQTSADFGLSAMQMARDNYHLIESVMAKAQGAAGDILMTAANFSAGMLQKAEGQSEMGNMATLMRSLPWVAVAGIGLIAITQIYK